MGEGFGLNVSDNIRTPGTYDDGLNGRQQTELVSRTDRALSELLAALRLPPIHCGSLTLNFDPSGEFQSFETRTHQKVKK